MALNQNFLKPDFWRPIIDKLKRDFRRLWITRISAAAKMNGMNYSTFMNGLNKAGVQINRKMLADIAVNDEAGFANLVKTAQKALEK